MSVSHDQWEEGEFKLPSTEFSKLRQVLADQDTAEKTALFEHAQMFWKGLSAKQKSDRRAYELAYAEYEEANSHVEGVAGSLRRRAQVVSHLPDGFRRLVGADRRSAKPARVLKEQMSFPTNRTLEFCTPNGGAVATFNRAMNTVRWAAAPNNGAVDAARPSTLRNTLFRHLDQVRWTRGTGGVVTGNHEYNEDENGQARNDYTVAAFGPLGGRPIPATAGGVKQGRLAANNGAKSGEFLRKSQSLPEVKL